MRRKAGALLLLLAFSVQFFWPVVATAANTTTVAPSPPVTPATPTPPPAATNTGGISLTVSDSSRITGEPPRVKVESLDTNDIQTRLDKYKKQLKTTLTADTEDRLAARCEAAQAVIKKVASANEKVTADRMNAYNTILNKASDIIARADSDKLDVADLKKTYDVLQLKVTDFQGVLKAYRQALADLSSISCKDDTSGFEAALQAARSDQFDVTSTAKDVRDYLTTTIRPLLIFLEKDIDNKATTASGGQ